MGIDGPYMSASKIPTSKPICAKETAKFAVIVDFPTPPFPEATAMIFLIPAMGFPLICGFSCSAATTLRLTFIFAFS
jgi:hypothetical protein